MKKGWAFLLLTLIPAAGWAAAAPSSDPGSSGYSAEDPEGIGRIAADEEFRRYGDDGRSGAQENFGVQPVHDNEVFAVLRGDRIEYQVNSGKNHLLWDVWGWVGSDYDKLYLESEGTWQIDEEEVEEAELQVLYARNVAAFWDLQAGVRHDFRPKPTRTFAALGLQGTAPYWFEVDATAYVSEDGDISADLEAEYDILLSQRLILQPRFEVAAAVQGVEENGVGRGINDIELGARMRYEIRREFAPYIGVSWHRKLGDTADLAKDEGEDIDVVSFVAGIKLWF